MSILCGYSYLEGWQESDGHKDSELESKSFSQYRGVGSRIG